MDVIPILDVPGLLRAPPEKLPSKENLFQLVHHHLNYQLVGFQGFSSISCRMVIQRDRRIAVCQVLASGLDIVITLNVQNDEGCAARGAPCLLFKVKERWINAGLPLKEDHNIISLLTKTWKEFTNQRRNMARMTEEKKVRLRAGWAVTVNLAPEGWEAIIRSDWHSNAAEHTRKINMLKDYIGRNATRYFLKLSLIFTCTCLGQS